VVGRSALRRDGAERVQSECGLAHIGVTGRHQQDALGRLQATRGVGDPGRLRPRTEGGARRPASKLRGVLPARRGRPMSTDPSHPLTYDPGDHALRYPSKGECVNALRWGLRCRRSRFWAPRRVNARSRGSPTPPFGRARSARERRIAKRLNFHCVQPVRRSGCFARGERSTSRSLGSGAPPWEKAGVYPGARGNPLPRCARAEWTEFRARAAVPIPACHRSSRPGQERPPIAPARPK
jgi:hypothetical protein